MNNSARLLTVLDELAASDRRNLLTADLCAAAKTGRKASGSRSHRKNPAVGDTLGISNSSAGDTGALHRHHPPGRSGLPPPQRVR